MISQLHVYYDHLTCTCYSELKDHKNHILVVFAFFKAYIYITRTAKNQPL